MPLYAASLTAPAFTSGVNPTPVSVEIPIFNRYWRSGRIVHPKNCVDLVRVSLYWGNTRVVPAGLSPTPYLLGNDLMTHWLEQRDLGGSPRSVWLFVTNYDDTRERTISVQIEAVDFPDWLSLYDMGGG